MSENTPVPAPKPEPSAAPAQTPAQVPGAAAGSTAAALAAPVTTPASPADDEDVQDKQARAGRLEGELQKLRSELRAGAKAVMRVLPPHNSMTWAGHTVTDEPTEVPASAVAGLHEAALNAGVELIQEN
jgi:hypothetical protein